MGASARAERAACARAAAACLSAGEAELARCALRRLAGLGAEGRDAARRCARAAARGDAPREWAGGDAELLAWLCAAELRCIEGGVGAAAEQAQEAEPEPAEAARALEARARVRLLAERVCREVRAVDVSELQHWAEGAVLATIGGGFVSCGDAPAAALAAAACEAPSALRALALALRADAPAAAAAIDDAQAAAIERCAPIEGALAAAERLAMLGGSLSEEQWLGALRAVLLEKSEAGSAPGLSEDESVARAAIRSVAACGSERGMRCLEVVMAEATAQVSRGTGSPALVRSTSRTRRVERNVFSALESGMPYAEAQVRDAIRALADRGYDGTEGLPASLVLLAAVVAWDERRGDVDAQVRASDSAARVLSGGAGRTGSAAVASSRALEGACEQLAHRVLAARFLCEHAERNPSSMPLDMKGALHVLESASVLAAACELAPHAPRADLLRLVSATPLGALARGDRPAADAALVCSSAALAAAARLSAGMRASRALTTGNAQALTLEIERSLGALRVPAMRTWVLKLVCVIVLMEAEDKADIDVNAESRTGTSVGPAPDALAVLRQLFAMLNAQLQTLPGGAGRASAKAGADDTGGHGGLDAILQGKGMEGLEERAQPRSAGDRAAGADAGDSDKDAGSVLFFSSEWEAASAARRVELADKFEDVAWRIQLMGELPAPISNEGHTRVQRSDASQEWDWRGAVAMLRASPGDLVGLCTRHGRYDLANEVARHCNLPEADRSALQLKRWVDGVTSAAAVGNSEGMVWGDGEGAAPLDIAGAGVAVSDTHAAALCLDLAAAISSDGDLCVRLLQQAHTLLEAGAGASAAPVVDAVCADGGSIGTALSGDWLPRALVYLFAAANAGGDGGAPLRASITNVDAIAAGGWPAEFESHARIASVAAFGKATQRLREAVGAARDGQKQFLSGILHNLARALGECRGVDAAAALSVALRQADASMPPRGTGHVSPSTASDASMPDGAPAVPMPISASGSSAGLPPEPISVKGAISGPSPDSATQPSLAGSVVAGTAEQSPQGVGSYLLEFAQYVADVGSIMGGEDASDAFDHFAVLARPPRDIIARLIFEGKSADAASAAAAAARRMRADIVEEVLATCVAPVLPPGEARSRVRGDAAEEKELRRGLKIEVLRHLAESSPVRAVLACVFGILQARAKDPASAGGLGGVGAADDDDDRSGTVGVDEQELMAFALETAEPFPSLHRWVAQQQQAAAASGGTPTPPAEATEASPAASVFASTAHWAEWEPIESHAAAVASLARSGRVRQALALADKWLPTGPSDDLLEACAREADPLPGDRAGAGAEESTDNARTASVPAIPGSAGASSEEASTAVMRIACARRAACIALECCRAWGAHHACNALESIAARIDNGDDDAGGTNQTRARELRARARAIRLSAKLSSSLNVGSWQRAEDALSQDAGRVLAALTTAGDFALAAEVEAECSSSRHMAGVPLAPKEARVSVRAAHVADLVARHGSGAGTVAALKYLASLGADAADAAFEAMRCVPLRTKRSLTSFLSSRGASGKLPLSDEQRLRLERAVLGVDILATLPSPWDDRCGSLHEHPPLVLETLLMHQQLGVASTLRASFPRAVSDTLIATYAGKALATDLHLARASAPSTPSSAARGATRSRSAAHPSSNASGPMDDTTTGPGAQGGSVSPSLSTAAAGASGGVLCLTGEPEMDAARRAAHLYPAAPSAVLFVALIELVEGVSNRITVGLPIVRDRASKLRAPEANDAVHLAASATLVGELARAAEHLAALAKGAVHSDADQARELSEALGLSHKALLEGFAIAPSELLSVEPEATAALALRLARDERWSLALRVCELARLPRADVLLARADAMAAAGNFFEAADAFRAAVEGEIGGNGRSAAEISAAATRLAARVEVLPSPLEAASAEDGQRESLRAERVDFARELLAEWAPGGLAAMLCRQGHAPEACGMVLSQLGALNAPPASPYAPLSELIELCVVFEQVTALMHALEEPRHARVSRWATLECCGEMARAPRVGFMFNLLRMLGAAVPAGVAALMLAGAQEGAPRALDLCKVAQSLFEQVLQASCKPMAAFGALAPLPASQSVTATSASSGDTEWASASELAAASSRCADAVARVVDPAAREAAGLKCALSPAELRGAHLVRLGGVASLQAAVVVELQRSISAGSSAISGSGAGTSADDARARPASDWGLVARDQEDVREKRVHARRAAAAEALLVAGGPDASSLALRVTTEFRLGASTIYAAAAARLAAEGRRTELQELLRDSRASLASQEDRDIMLRAAAAAAATRGGWGASQQAEKLAAMVQDPRTRVLAYVGAHRLRAALGAAKALGEAGEVAIVRAAAAAALPPEKSIIDACDRWEAQQRDKS